MIAFCKYEARKKHGKDRKGNQRFRCQDCGATFAESAPKPLGNMRIDPAKAGNYSAIFTATRPTAL